ncbi:hypothetical protein SLH47_26130 [Cognatiyoonia sp. IB215182]|nr:hypothetical protein [Cognatiyoonia sp. IB215182]
MPSNACRILKPKNEAYLMLRAAIMSILLGAPAAADVLPDRVGLIVGSHHVNPQQDFEEFNPGVYLAWDGEIFDGQTALFQNSLGDPALAITFSLKHMTASWGGLNTASFLGTAYYGDGAARDYNLNGWIPFGGLRISHDAWPLGLQVMPCPPTECSVVFALTVGL